MVQYCTADVRRWVFLRIASAGYEWVYPEEPMRLLATTAFLLVVAGCGLDSSVRVEDVEKVADDTRPLATCTFDLPADVTALFAWDDGLAVARAGLVQRMDGAGCALSASRAPVAAEQLLDVDLHGALYVFPSEAPPTETTASRTISTMLDGEYPQSMVARVSLDDEVSKMTAAGRGIWSFGVAADGSALWQDACGPTGIFDVTPEGVAPSTLGMPSTWGVLTDAHTFWSVGAHDELVRTSRDGSVAVSAVEQRGLARCGAHVCGVSAGAVVEWDDAGTVVRTLTREDVGAGVDEDIASVTTNRHGTYVTLRRADIAAGSMRVVFVP